MNCWEYMDCPREVRGRCPAYPDNGKDCWKMPSTMCAGGRYKLSTLVEKISFCRICEFYKMHANRPEGLPPDEPEAVDEETARPGMPE